MPAVLLLTCDSIPRPDLDSAITAAALAGLGIDTEIVAWTDPRLSTMTADLAIIRTTWDYSTALPDFLRTLRSLPFPVANAVGVVEWNCHKGYLVELAAAGIPVVPTVVVQKNSEALSQLPTLPFPTGPFPTLPFPEQLSEIIIKPATSAGARGVGRFAINDPAAIAHLQSIIEHADALIQPFAADIVDGEVSLIYFAGTFSHAVRKVPATGDFRVQIQHGGSVQEHFPTDSELMVAQAAIAGAPGQLMYARVDLVPTASGPQVMELELIEPQLFLTELPATAQRFAEVIREHLMGSA